MQFANLQLGGGGRDQMKFYKEFQFLSNDTKLHRAIRAKLI